MNCHRMHSYETQEQRSYRQEGRERPLYREGRGGASDGAQLRGHLRSPNDFRSLITRREFTIAHAAAGDAQRVCVGRTSAPDTPRVDSCSLGAQSPAAGKASAVKRTNWRAPPTQQQCREVGSMARDSR